MARVASSPTVETFSYDNSIVRAFGFVTVLWGIVGFLVGLLIALQLPFPQLNLGEYFTFGRLRPLHTNAVIFAFVGNGIFMGIYYSLQRLCKARMGSDFLSWFHFWGWQAIIVLAALTLPLGITTSKEYAELEWPIDILIAVVWVAFGANMIWTIVKRRVEHMYVAIWFYIATFITVAVLHIVNSLAVPVSLFKSYSVFSGVQDALVQWWYGHNAVAFFLTTPYLGLMYYFIPKVSGRPVYSYRLSIIHFWALVFIYIWAGPHHLLYSAVPHWAQALGTAFSIMLIAPSWGGMLNGLFTLRGAWDKVKEDPVLKFMVVAVTCYGMATLEGPIMSLRNVNALAHFTDWVIGHVHIGALGWNGFMTFGMLYWLVPKLYNTKLYSLRLAGFHFWMGTLGILFYGIAMYFSGITQGLMWKEMTPEGLLKYPNFLETVLQLKPFYYLRAIGGLMYIVGAIVMAYNLIKTAKAGVFIGDEEVSAPALRVHKAEGEHKLHRMLEGRPAQFFALSLVAILVGSIFEIVPGIVGSLFMPQVATVRPYTPLEIIGRDIYVREGCNTCHSQMVRPFVSETKRFGAPSTAEEYAYDHPFLWGSKRTGPDLHRIGGKYPDAWHYEHMKEPRYMSPGSIMPAYSHLIGNDMDLGALQAKVKVMRSFGAPYGDEIVAGADKHLEVQAQQIAKGLASSSINVAWNKEIIALVAYLQSLGAARQIGGK